MQHKLEKRDYHFVLNSMRVLELGLRIPLCRLVPLPRVRPVQEVDVRCLEVQFEDSDGYDDVDCALYVSIFNDKEETCDVEEEHRATWSPHWHCANEAFELEFASSDVYAPLRGKMFFIWDGNHRFQAWWQSIKNNHFHEARWHFFVICIVLNPRGRIGPLLNAMYDVNW